MYIVGSHQVDEFHVVYMATVTIEEQYMRMMVRSWQLKYEALRPLKENFFCN